MSKWYAGVGYNVSREEADLGSELGCLLVGDWRLGSDHWLLLGVWVDVVSLGSVVRAAVSRVSSRSAPRRT